MADERGARRALVALGGTDCRRCGRTVDVDGTDDRWVCRGCRALLCPWCSSPSVFRCRHLLATVGYRAPMHPRAYVRFARGAMNLADISGPDPARCPLAGWSTAEIQGVLGDLSALVTDHHGDLFDMLQSAELFDAVCRRVPDLIDIVVHKGMSGGTDEWPHRPRERAYFASDRARAWEYLRDTYAALAERLLTLTRTPPATAMALLRFVASGGQQSHVSPSGDVVVWKQQVRPDGGRVCIVRPWEGVELPVNGPAARQTWPTHVRISADDERLIMRRIGEYQGWDTRTGSLLWRKRVVAEHGGPALDPSFTRLTCRVGHGLVMLDPRDGRLLWHTRRGPRSALRSVRLGDHVVMLGGVASVDILAPDGTPLQDAELYSYSRPAISPDGRQVCMTTGIPMKSDIGVVITWWDTTDGRLLDAHATRAPRDGHVIHVPSALYSRDGETLLTATSSSTVDDEAGWGVTLWNASTHAPIHTFQHRWPVTAVTYSRDGRLVVTADEYGVSLWDTATRERVRRWPRHERIEDLHVSAGHDSVIAASSRGVVRVLPVEGEMELAVHHPQRNGVSVSGDGTLFATVQSRSVVVRAASSGIPVAVLDHVAPVSDVALSHDGRTIATYSADRMTRVWRLPDHLGGTTGARGNG